MCNTLAGMKNIHTYILYILYPAELSLRFLIIDFIEDLYHQISLKQS